MKLELKHLSPYLPYKLGLKFYDKQIEMHTGNVLSVLKFVNLDIEEASKHYFPILRPLSDLTKDDYQYLNEKLIPHNANFGVGKKGNFVAHGCVGLSLSSTYKVFQYYFKNHFDVFGLIEKGLAIDINTLKL